jgi:hypothetical protein
VLLTSSFQARTGYVLEDSYFSVEPGVYPSDREPGDDVVITVLIVALYNPTVAL